MATGAGTWQHITEPLGGKQGSEIDDLHRLPLTRQPTRQGTAMAEGQRPGQGNPAANEWQPTLDAIRTSASLCAAYPRMARSRVPPPGRIS